jgi:hypothetical protein
MAELTEGIVTRRALLGGLGAGGAALAGGVATAGSVGASAAAPGASAAAGSAATATTAASAHQAGISYVYRTPFEFQLMYAATVRGTNTGVTPGNDDPLVSELPMGRGDFVASVDLPPGALLHDVEWYACVFDDEPASVFARVWLAGGDWDDMVTVVGGQLPRIDPPEERVDAYRLEVPADQRGPWPEGSKLLLYTRFEKSSTGLSLSGARVGFAQAPRQLMMLTDPVRVYDSRTTGGALVPNASRVIPLGAAVPTSAAGALVSLSITASQGTGTLRAGRAGVSPTATALQWSRTGDKVTNLVSTGISAEQEMVVQSISATGATHVIAEVVGYLM